MTAARFSLESSFRTTLGFEDRCVVAEAFLPQFFHQLDGDVGMPFSRACFSTPFFTIARRK